ncbi:NUDIX hydrolase [Streptomyces durbertensis]|uniref:NUDIX hydrolase n=1 Tax=Streptomyces durbertensis TaxID=2448886 RepID=A0ABR6EGH0_9ACTN|nr:NUDIX domain-containing protein [Streptomyces durbertensis]MBB1243584.1 NUDIX hydrolase [Streptomyces durbertensis]
MTAPPAPSSARGLCDHASVGVLISSPDGLLLFERARPPAGIAPVAGHLDQHGGPEAAAHAEVTEEVGLTVTHLHLLLKQWRPNKCRRTPAGPVGHQWWIFQAQVSGTLRPSDHEVRRPRWLPPDRLRQYALRTAAYAEGRLGRREFEHDPGLDPVWVRFLHDLHMLKLPAGALDRIDTVL